MSFCILFVRTIWNSHAIVTRSRCHWVPPRYTTEVIIYTTRQHINGLTFVIVSHLVWTESPPTTTKLMFMCFCVIYTLLVQHNYRRIDKTNKFCFIHLILPLSYDSMPLLHASVNAERTIQIKFSWINMNNCGGRVKTRNSEFRFAEKNGCLDVDMTAIFIGYAAVTAISFIGIPSSYIYYTYTEELEFLRNKQNSASSGAAKQHLYYLWPCRSMSHLVDSLWSTSIQGHTPFYMDSFALCGMCTCQHYHDDLAYSVVCLELIFFHYDSVNDKSKQIKHKNKNTKTKTQKYRPFNCRVGYFCMCRLNSTFIPRLVWNWCV